MTLSFQTKWPARMDDLAGQPNYFIDKIMQSLLNVRQIDSLIADNYYGKHKSKFDYRMLKPHEIKLAMAFEKDYVVLGSGKDQVKQCGEYAARNEMAHSAVCRIFNLIISLSPLGGFGGQ